MILQKSFYYADVELKKQVINSRAAYYFCVKLDFFSEIFDK